MPSLSMADMASRTKPMAKKNWIKKAVKPERRGVLKAKAEAAGESTAAFAKKHDGDKGTLGKEPRLAENLMGLRKKKSPLYDHPRSRKD